MISTEITPQKLLASLAKVKPNDINSAYPKGILEGKVRPAAILIPFTQVQEEWHLVFIARTQNPNDKHSGQVAFPGGGLKPGEDPMVGALRETFEEIGIPPRDVQVVGRLRDFVAISNHLVTPFVGFVPWPYPIMMDPREVRKVFTIPFEWLKNPAHYQIVQREAAPYPPFSVIYYQEFRGEILWGLTARIVHELIGILERI